MLKHPTKNQMANSGEAIKVHVLVLEVIIDQSGKSSNILVHPNPCDWMPNLPLLILPQMQVLQLILENLLHNWGQIDAFALIMIRLREQMVFSLL